MDLPSSVPQSSTVTTDVSVGIKSSTWLWWKITRTHGYLEVTHLFIHCFMHDSAKNMSHQYSSKESLPGQCEAIMIIYDDIYLVSIKRYISMQFQALCLLTYSRVRNTSVGLNNNVGVKTGWPCPVSTALKNPSLDFKTFFALGSY